MLLNLVYSSSGLSDFSSQSSFFPPDCQMLRLLITVLNLFLLSVLLGNDDNDDDDSNLTYIEHILFCQMLSYVLSIF